MTPPPSTWIPAPAPPSCGKLNQRPCTVVERIPSCKDGLTESIAQKKCIATPDGKLPFFATLNEMGELAVKAGKESQAAYLKRLNPIASSVPTSLFTNAAFKAVPTDKIKYVAVGFICAAPRILDTLTTLRDLDPIFWRNFEIAFNEAFNAKPCADDPNPAGRVACAIGVMVIGDAFSETVCTVKAFQKLPAQAGNGGLTTVDAANKLGEGIFILMHWSLEQYVSAKGAAPVKAKFKKKEVARRQKQDLKKGVSQDVRNIKRKVDRILDIVKNLMLIRLLDVLYDRLQRIPKCQGAVGQDVRIEVELIDAVAASAKDSEAAVNPGILYLVNSAGQLMMFQHDEHARFTVSAKVIGSGWNGMARLQAVRIPGKGGALYGVKANGDLLYYEHDANGNFSISGKKIGSGWNGAQHFVATRKGHLYLVQQNGELQVLRHDDSFKFSPPKVIGKCWGGFKTLIGGGVNAFYALTGDGNLRY
ncbi:MAG: tachylectin-related carbohydrate-binding protein [Rhodospirillaceae bacterium]